MEKAAEIYLITCKVTNKRYIGQAVCYLKNKDGTLTKHGTEGRWKSHVYSRNYKKSRCRLLANAIKDYGKDAFTVETLLITNIKLINMFEKMFIAKFNTLHPNGYNLNEGGSGGRHHQETKELISKSNTGKVRTDEMKRQMSEIKMVYTGLPEYIYALNDTKRKLFGYRVRKHPTLPEKKFCSKNLTMDQKLQQAIDYLNGIESNIEIPKPTRNQEWRDNLSKSKRTPKNLPKYIYETHDNNKNAHGYIIRNHPIISKKLFVSSKLSMEEKLQLAITYLESYQINEVHRPNGNGSQDEA